jgi:hypothetical protein
MANLGQAVKYGHGKIFTTTLNQLDVLSLLPFPLFYSLYITLIYGMFLNKALWVFDELGRYCEKKQGCDHKLVGEGKKQVCDHKLVGVSELN